MKFSFGRNWLSYSLRALSSERVEEARRAFKALTAGIDLRGARFLDIGFGQGLALFLAEEAGAEAYGIDVDPVCANALKITQRFFSTRRIPRVGLASVLDVDFVQAEQARGGFDLVHSWGALHHTGDMAKAFHHAAELVKPGGFLIVSIYNRHWTSPLWRILKYAFSRLPSFLQEMAAFLLYPVFYFRARSLARGETQLVSRGMDLHHDIRDWLGGYPYEYASQKEVEDRLVELGFRMLRCRPTKGFTGCNEFVFQKKNNVLSATATEPGQPHTGCAPR